MMAIVLQTIKRMRGAILGWGLSFTALAVLVGAIFDSVAAQGAALDQLLESFPPGFMAMFGEVQKLNTAAGFLGMELFSYTPFVLGIFAVLAGSGLILSDEEDGVLDLLLANPISRSTFFAGRVIGLAVASAAILLLMFIGLQLAQLVSAEMHLSATIFLRALTLLYIQILFFAALALMFSFLLPGRTLAAMLSGVLLIFSYFSTTLTAVDDRLAQIAKFSPIYYYPGGKVLLVDANWGQQTVLLGIIVFFVAVAWWQFKNRDLRVSGEDVWRLPLPWRRAMPDVGR